MPASKGKSPAIGTWAARSICHWHRAAGLVDQYPDDLGRGLPRGAKGDFGIRSRGFRAHLASGAPLLVRRRRASGSAFRRGASERGWAGGLLARFSASPGRDLRERPTAEGDIIRLREPPPPPAAAPPPRGVEVYSSMYARRPWGRQLRDLKPSRFASVCRNPGSSDSCGNARQRSSSVHDRCSVERSYTVPVDTI